MSLAGLRDRLAGPLLAAVAIVPAWTFAWGSEEGRLIYVLYREPKLVALLVLVPLALLAIAAWQGGRALGPASLAAAVRQPPVVLLLAWLAWSTATAAWSRVTANSVYELRQLDLLVALLIAAVAWSRHEPRVPRLLAWALVVAMGAATAIGLVQRLVTLPLLVPIDPVLVAHPSVMGYKNPMALALVGQLFLLAGLLRTAARRPARWALGFLLALEVAYLLTLQSRTAYAALVVGLLVAGMAELASGSRAPRRFTLLAALALATGALLAVAFEPAVRTRLESAVAYLRDPGSYLESDRGVYLQNTLHMVRHRPLGVGIGDWQTQYPVYRAVGRYRWFDDTAQVRRAHSDHVQILGETGWPGLALWLGFWLAAIVQVARAARRRRDPWAGYVAAQLVALFVAMASDYVLELPYGKLQVVLVWTIALGLRPPSGARAVDTPSGTGRPAPRLVLPALAIVALVCAGEAWHLDRATRTAAGVEWRYRVWRSMGEPTDAAGLAALLPVDERSERLLHLRGHTKTRSRAHEIAAHTTLILGRLDAAEQHAARALRLHPYRPSALRLMGAIRQRRGDVDADDWGAAARFVMDEARDGFDRPYPRIDR